jgi:hypothetical protein
MQDTQTPASGLQGATEQEQLASIICRDVDGRVLLADGRTMAPPGGRMPKTAFAAWLAAVIMPLARARVAGPA